MAARRTPTSGSAPARRRSVADPAVDALIAVRAFGLVVSSDVPLPLPAETSDVPADVVVRRAPAAPRAPDDERRWICPTPSLATFRMPGVGGIEVHDGREILVDPDPDVAPGWFAQFVIGPALGLLLAQRDLLVLHACAVRLGTSVVAFLGDAGWGKSTLAGSLLRAGHPLWSEDVTAVEGAPPRVLPGLPRLKLWPDSARALGWDPATLPKIRTDEDESKVEVAVPEPTGDAPLRRLVVLDGGDALALEPMTATEALPHVVRHGFAAFVEHPDMRVRRFLKTGDLLRAVPVARLRVPRDLARTAELAAFVAERT